MPLWERLHSRRQRHSPIARPAEVDRSIPIRIDVTRRAGGEADERAVLKKCIESDRTYVMDHGYASFALFNRIVAAGVLGDICGLASEDELLAHKREVATATSRFMNAALVDVIDRLKPVLLSGSLLVFSVKRPAGESVG